MSIDRAAGARLAGLPLAFNLFFFLLGRFFDYPCSHRSPVGTVLADRGIAEDRVASITAWV